MVPEDIDYENLILSKDEFKICLFNIDYLIWHKESPNRGNMDPEMAPNSK